jgi:tetratricopeptide (TPR) repeat protein
LFVIKQTLVPIREKKKTKNMTTVPSTPGTDELEFRKRDSLVLSPPPTSSTSATTTPSPSAFKSPSSSTVSPSVPSSTPSAPPSVSVAPTPPPLQAFRGLPLSSGTIGPPRLEQSKFDDTLDSDDDNVEVDDEEDEDEGVPIPKVKGIDEFLNADSASDSDDYAINGGGGSDLNHYLGKATVPEPVPVKNQEKSFPLVKELSYDQKDSLDLTTITTTLDEETHSDDSPDITTETPKAGNVDKDKSLTTEAKDEKLGVNSTTTIVPKISTNSQKRGSMDNAHHNTTDYDTRSVSSFNSNTRSLVPRSLDSSQDYQNSLDSKKHVDMNLSLRQGGSNGVIRPPYSNSSHDGDSSKDTEEQRIEKDMNRMKHLGLLLDKHHQQIRTRRRNTPDDNGWQNDNDFSASSTDDRTNSIDKEWKSEWPSDGLGINRSIVESSEEGGEGHGRGQFSINSSEASTPNNRRTSIGTTGSVSSIDLMPKRFLRRRSLASVTSNEQGRKTSASLFENFDKTWQSYHLMSSEDKNEDQGPNDEFVREQLCFASMVLVLLQQAPAKVQEQSTLQRNPVPLDVVKLFWKEVIFAKNDDNSTLTNVKISSTCDIDVITESITDCLLNKLRYISTHIDTAPSQIDQATDTSVCIKLSHDVYADYSRHILKKYTEDNPQEQVNEWNAKFIRILENLLLTYNKEENAETQMSQQIIYYAALHIPKLILLSFHPALSNSSSSVSMSNEEYKKDRVKYFVSIMKNPGFLSQRMNILGANNAGQIFPKQNDSEKDQRGRFQPESFVDSMTMDVLKATKAHLEDLESILSIISMMSTEIFIESEDGVLDATDAVLSMYKAWKELCLSMIQKPADSTLLHGVRGDTTKSTAQEPTEMESASLTHSKPESQNKNRRPMKENRFDTIIKASELTQTTLPKHFRLGEGEYKMANDGTEALLEKIAPIGLTNTDFSKRSRKRSQRKETKRVWKAIMKLPEVLEIDPVRLYHVLSIGKSIHLLGKSIFDATLYTNETRTKSDGLRTLLGGKPNAASIGYSITSINIYIQLTHLMSFMLSDDLTGVDGDDLIDVGYYYDKDTGSLDPSSRLKKLSQDIINTRCLMEKVNTLRAETWLAMGTYLQMGIGAGHGNIIEMSAVALLNHLNESAVQEVDPSHEEKTFEIDYKKESKEEQPEDDYKYSLQFKVLLCFQMALGILLHNPSFDKKSISSYESNLTDVVVHERNIEASIIHSIGVYYYEQVGDYDRAKACLDSSLGTRRLLLRLLQREDPDDLGSMSGSSVGSRSIKRSYKRSSRRTNNRHKTKPKKEGPLQSESSNQVDVVLCLENTRKKQVAMIEKGVSSTLEFSALVSHSLLENESSLSLFQEALILRALHSGKDSLEVANLQYNMGVVHDDLAEYESSLSRYGESLRVRFSLLEKLKHEITSEASLMSATLELIDLEASVILTLKCMGNVYRALKDRTNSIGCLMKAIQLLKDKLKRRTTDTSIGLYQSEDGDLGFGKGMTGPFPTLPAPMVMLDEIKCKDEHSSFQMKSFEFAHSTPIDLGEDDAIRKDIANMYTTMMTLANERATHASTIKMVGKSGYASSTSFSSAASTPSRAYKAVNKDSKNKGLNPNSDNDTIILDCASNLGLLALHFNDHKNGLQYFEEALRTLWTSFSGETSGESSGESDSDLSSSRASISPSTSSKRSRKTYFKGQVEEGALYHALAVAHASLSDHERAIRCYVTALRYYRRRFGLGSSIVAGALYDCAYSYWKLNDFSRAEDFWADCLKILLSCNGVIDNTKSQLSPLYDLHVARTLYNVAASKICKAEYSDQYIGTCLNDASNLFRGLSERIVGQTFNVEIGHCHFYSGFVYYKKSLNMEAATKRKSFDALQHDSSSVNIDELKCKEGHLHQALSSVDDSLNSYLSENRGTAEGFEKTSIGQKLQHPMQGHIAHLSAWIHDALGSITQAQWNYKTSIRLLNKVYSPENIYSASAMHSLGNIYLGIGNVSEAIKYYEQSLSLRAKILGSDHSAVADTLECLAGITGNIPNYAKATAMYMHCIKIRTKTEGKDGENVASTLLSLALLHGKFGHNRKSQDCLEGALKVRRSKLQTAINGFIVNVEQCTEGEDDFGEDQLQETVRREHIELAIVLHHLGNNLLKMGDITKAKKLYDEALTLRCKLCGVGDGGFAEFVQQEDLECAIELNRDILRDMADTLHNIGGIYETKIMQQQALSCYNQSLIIKRTISKEKKVEFSLDDQIKSCNSLSSAITLLRIGAIHNELHNHDVGLSYYKSALRIQRQHLGRDHIAVAQTLAEMGIVLRKQIQIDNLLQYDSEEQAGLEFAATKCLNEALRISKLCYGPNHVSVAGVMLNIGSIHDQKGDYNKAIDCYQHSVKIYGREYAKTLCRSLFDTSSIRGNCYDTIVDTDYGLFHPTTLRNNLPGIEKRTSVLFSRGLANSPSILSEIDRDDYMNASIALAQAATRSGMIYLHNGTFQSFVLRLLHFITVNGVDPFRGTIGKRIAEIFGNFEKAGAHAIVTVKDVPQNNYLYLIQE